MAFWIIVLTLWAFCSWVQSRTRRKKEDERFANVINALNRLEPRLNDLKKVESRVAELEHRLATSAPPAPVTAQPPVTAAPPPAPAPKPVEPPPLPPLALGPEIPKPPAPRTLQPPEAHTSVPPVLHPAEAPAPHPLTTTPPAPPHKPAPLPPAPFAAHPPTPPRPVPPPLSPPPKPVRVASSQFEELFGKNWLSKIGITGIVIGIAYLLGGEFDKLGNPAKIALCYLASFLILGAGVRLERRDRYRIFARALIGGGWALIFFVTFAMHFVSYTRVIDTQSVDLILLFVVAAAMVLHTLRYDSQVVTGMAFLLAFTTVAISQNTIYSLSAGAILALGLVVIVHRRQWFELEVFGILASYGNHFLWLANVIVPVNGHHRIFPEFVPSTVLLCLYWAIYRWSYIARQIKTPTQETVSTLAALLNTSLLLTLLKYQAIRPELAFYALLLLGAVELALGQLPMTRERRVAFTILSSMGIVLLVAAIPFKYSGMDTAIIWLAEAQIVLLAGVFSEEMLFRIFGMLVALLTSGDMLFNQALPKLYDRLSWPSVGPLRYLPQSLPAPDPQLALSFLLAGLLFYANALGIPRRWKNLITSEVEGTSFRGFSYLAGLMLFVSLWLAFPYAWTAVLWMALAFVLILLARSFGTRDLAYQSHVFAFAAFVRALDINASLARPFLHAGLSLRLVTLSLVIALLYLCARWLVATEAAFPRNPSELYTTAAAILFVILSYRESDPVWIGPAWGAFALTLAISGYFRDRRDLSLQAHFLVFAGFARTLLFNIDATQEWHHFTDRFLTYTLMAALLYVCAYFSGPRDSAHARLFSALETWCGSVLIAVLAFKEISSPWIAVAWAVFALLLLIIGNRVKRIQLHLQAYLLSISAFVQAVSVNLNNLDRFPLIPSLSLRLVTIVLVAAVFYLCARFAAKGDFVPAPIAGATYLWAASALVVLLIDSEAAPFAVALEWSVFALALFELGLSRKSRNFRAQAYAIFLLCFLRFFLFNLDGPAARLLAYTLPIALVFYYAFFRLMRLTSGQPPLKDFAFAPDTYAATALAYLGSATLFLFANSYYHHGWILIAWAALSFLWIAVTWASRFEVFLDHSVIAALLVAIRALFFEYTAKLHPGGPYWGLERGFYVAAVAAILFAGQAFAFPLSKRPTDARAKSLSRDLGVAAANLHAEQIYFFLAFVLVTLLILNEVPFGRVTIAWGIEAVAAFLFALLVRERSFRLAAHGLLLLCIAKLGLVDALRLHGSDRYLTWLVFGAVCTLISFLYTRYWDTIRRYL